MRILEFIWSMIAWTLIIFVGLPLVGSAIFILIISLAWIMKQILEFAFGIIA